MRRAVVVINPLSGRGRYDNQIRAHAALAEDILGGYDYQAIVRPTTRAGDARRFAVEAVTDAADLVVVWGGDGTVNEAASALVHTAVPMAIVPAGSGNGSHVAFTAKNRDAVDSFYKAALAAGATDNGM